jgi:flagellar hook-length control protein FliK
VKNREAVALDTRSAKADAPEAAPAKVEAPAPQPVQTVAIALSMPAVTPQPAMESVLMPAPEPALTPLPSLAAVATPQVEGAQTEAAAPPGPEAAPEAITAPLSSQDMASAGLPSALVAQSLPVDTRASSFGIVYDAAKLVAEPQPHATVSAQAGRIGQDMGVEIARSVAAGRNEITVRLDPPEMGRVEVRLSFDHGGAVRAVVTAENHSALALLQREAGDLYRALGDAGVRTDGQSFRFDSQNSGAGSQQGRHGQQDMRGSGAARAAASEDEPVYRPLRASGRIDMMA